MRTLAIAILILASSAAYAQQSIPPAPALPPPQPGPVLQAATPDDAATRLDVEIGAIRMTTHSGRYTMAYLPFLAPLQGTAFRPSREMPNALALTNTTIPQKPYVQRSAVISKR